MHLFRHLYTYVKARQNPVKTPLEPTCYYKQLTHTSCRVIGLNRQVMTFHITAEAPLSALKSAIAKNGMGVTSRP